MVAQGNKLFDDLLPEIEMSLTPCKLSENVRIDLHRLSDDFVTFLVKKKHIADDVHNDVQIIPLSKVPKFCQTIRDAFRVYNIERNANVQV